MGSSMVILLSGATATLMMVVVMYALVWEGFQHGDAIRVLGGDLTKKPKQFFSMGMILYFATGLLLSWVYYWVLAFLKFETAVVSTAFAGFMGVCQGFVLMHFYIEGLGSHHPVTLYKKFWLPVSVAHWFGHLIYGISIGSLISAFLIFGSEGFYIGLSANLLLVLMIAFFANKKRIFTKWKKSPKGSESFNFASRGGKARR